MRSALAPAALLIGLIAALSGENRGADPATDATAGPAADPLPAFISAHCLGCHDGEDAEAGLDLAALRERADFAADLFDWREVREKLRTREMPPADEPRPDESAIEAVVAHLDLRLAGAIAALPQEPGRVTVRRLNRREYAATVRDLLGIELEIEDLLPRDDVGEGFDHIGDVLGLPPMLLEKYVSIAEELARDAVLLPGESVVPVRRVEGTALAIDGGGDHAGGGAARLWSHGEVWIRHRFPRDGTYRIGFEGYGEQAGPEPVRLALAVDGERRTEVEVPATRRNPASHELEARVLRGTRRVAVEFTNDYYRPEDPDPSQRDRNAAVLAISVEGPLEGLEPTAFQRAIWPEEPDPAAWRAALAEALPGLIRRAWRRPAAPGQVEALLDLVARATPAGASATPAGASATPAGASATSAGASASAHLRTAIVALLVSPRFLFRLEEDPPGAAPGSIRDLDGFERATRLSFFLHGTAPDEALLAAAAAGELDDAGVRAHAARMLADPRAGALSAAFVPQWLHFAHLATLRPDRERFPGVDERLLADLRAETIALFEHVRREGRPVRELVGGGYTFLNRRLARHYGIRGVEGDALRRVEVGSARGGGFLAQGSILLATSSPTRTSPVMRGKWLLETLLDAPPPPPPPGAGTLPEPGTPGSELGVREQMERHRRDPVCASCHRRMDALGFALEEFDAVGRWRGADGAASVAAPIDCRGELPDGRVLDGVAGLREFLAEERGFLRALARNLLIYALGRGLVQADEPALERCIARLEREPTIPALVDEIVSLDAFLRRRVPETVVPARADAPGGEADR